MKKEDDIYLKHVLESISDIEKSLKNISKENFSKNKDVQDAIIRRIEIIGEAIKNISEKTKKKYPETEWKKIAGTRDVLIHSYFSVDIDLVWEIVQRDLPILKKQIKDILNKI